MRCNEFLINYGGEWLDVDAQSVGGFDFTTLWTLDSTRAVEKGRTMDLSVPATKKNTMAFNSHKMIPGEGMRRGINGMVVAGGVNITGKIYVTEYSGGRYSLMMAYGNDFAGFGDVYYRTAFASDTMTFQGKENPVKSGAVPGFGWYEYYNALHPHAVTDSPPTMFPVTNLGHVIDRLAAYFGYTVNYPDISLGRGYQASAYGLILPSFGVQSIQGGADVGGRAMGGFSYTLTGAATLADLGLEVVTLEAVRGYTIQVVSIEYFRATKPVHISIPDNSNVVVFGRNPYDLRNDWEGTQGAEFDLAPGDVFSFARPDEWHTVAGEHYWNRYRVPPAFEGNVTVTFSVTRAAEYPAPGDTMYLAYALPEHPLEWWLDAYCNIIFAAWTVDEDTKTITVKTYGERLGDALADTDKHISLEKEKMIAVENVKRYIDGFAQHNHTRCAGDYEGLGSVNPFDRDLRMDNDYLPHERDMEEIPFNDGGIAGGSDTRYYLDINDVYKDSVGNYVYDGILTVFFENTVNSDGAVHLTEILNLGIGFSPENTALPETFPLFKNILEDIDGNKYDAVVIGDQVWMAENLRTTHYADGTAVTYKDMTSSQFTLRERGLFYNWSAVMHGASSSTSIPSGVQGVAPTGWHVPSKKEFIKLNNYLQTRPDCWVGDPQNTAKSMASQYGWEESTTEYAVGNDQSQNNNSSLNLTPVGAFANNTVYALGYAVVSNTTEAGNSHTFINPFILGAGSVSPGLSALYSKEVYYLSVRCVYDGTAKDFIDKYIANCKSYSIANAFSASVRLLLPLSRFTKLDGGSCVSFHGRNFVVKNAKWGEGVAQLELVCIPPQIPDHRIFVKQVSVKNVTCFDGADGEIQVEAINGTAPYTYSLHSDFSDSNNTGVFTGLAVTGPVQEGTDQYGGIVYCYKTVYVRDADGNTATGAVRLQSPVELEWLDVPDDMTVYCDEGKSYATVDLSMIHPSTRANGYFENIAGKSPDDHYQESTLTDGHYVPHNISLYAENDCDETDVASFNITVLPNL